VIQAAIASLQLEEPIDWPEVVALYEELMRRTRSPVVELNWAVAIAEAGDPARALAVVDRLPLEDYHYLHATRAELLRRLGRGEEARTAYRRGIELVHSGSERRFLAGRLAELDRAADAAGEQCVRSESARTRANERTTR
jgi:RNA polymerase sigma-70 factor (ECF subfamily)